METATIREVQHNLALYVRKVEHGDEIEIRRRNKVVARLIPAGTHADSERSVDWMDVAEWRRKTWGRARVSGTPVSRIVYESRGER